MSVPISIQKGAGFCHGVRKAIGMAEKALDSGKKIYCLGKIVHNPVEIQRLERKGMKFISHRQFRELSNATVLIRAHGEPPETYRVAGRNNIELIDATCPVLLKFQDRIRRAAETAGDSGAHLLVYGRKDHPEVTALLGHSGGRAIAFQDPAELAELDFHDKFFLFAQTTVDEEKFKQVIRRLEAKIASTGEDPGEQLIVNDTVCRHVTCRKPDLLEFARNNGLILFVSGKDSSNGKTLFAACLGVNRNSYFISHTKELDSIDLGRASSIGISGATSTPYWLLKEVEQAVKRKLELMKE